MKLKFLSAGTLTGLVLSALLFVAVRAGGQENLAQPPRAEDVTPKAGPVKAMLLSDCDIPGLKNKINFDTKGAMDVITFIETLSSAKLGGDLNVVISSKAKGQVRLSLKEVTIGDALEIALTANGLAYEVKGAGERAIINILTDEEYRVQHGVGFYEQRKVKIVELKYAQPSRVNKMLTGVMSEIGKIIFDDVSGTLVLIDTPEKIAEMETIIQSAELPTIERQMPTITKVFQLKYSNVPDIEKEVTKLLTKEVGSMTVDDRTKTIIVTDVDNAMKKVENLILAFDRKPRQVALQAKIVEVELTDEFSMGVNWTHILDGLDPRFRIETKAPLSGGAGPTLNYKTIAAGGDLSVVIDALQSLGDTKIISNPHISVLDGEEAVIKVIRKQPYKEVAYESGTTNVIGVSYQFIDIGTTLAVTPRISDDGFISVDIKPTISDLIEWYDAPGGSGGVVGIPVIKESEATTSVVVKDGITIIIGGMIKSEKRQNELGIPVLRSIPVLGRLFESTVEKNKKTETIVFLTPQIISGDEPFMQRPDIGKDMTTRAGDDKGDVQSDEKAAQSDSDKAAGANGDKEFKDSPGSESGK